MKTSHAGVVALAMREGRKLTAYRDSVGVWTIGVGHTAAAGEPIPRPGLTITSKECDELFALDLAKYEKTVNSVIRVPVTQNQFDAMVSFCYNIGQGAFSKSTAARLVNHGDMAGAAKAFMLWVKPPEIKGRRNSERQQFLTPDAKPLGTTLNVTVTKPGFWVRLIAFLTRK